MGLKKFPIEKLAICLLFTVAAAGLAIYCVLPDTPWYSFTYVGVVRLQESRKDVWERYSSVYS